MSYQEASNFPGPLGHGGPPFTMVNAEGKPGIQGSYMDQNRTREPEPVMYHGEALARDYWAERYGPWIVLGFAAAFSLFLLIMQAAGQVPGKSFLLKDSSDIIQVIGGTIALIFCMRITVRLYRVSTGLQRELLQRSGERRTSNAMAEAHAEAQAAHRAFLAWTALTIGVASYVSGLAIWMSFDVRMSSADVPFPGLYDIGFVLSYPCFLIGTLLLTRRNKAAVGRVRLLLDALAVIGTALALSWFFLLSPVIAGLAQAPSAGAAFLSIYFPTGDLFLITIGALLMFSPLASRFQQPVFMLLCMGLFFLAISDSLLAYYSLSGSYNTGTLQDVLWPLSLSLVALAAIEYPRSMAREQEQAQRTKSSRIGMGAQLLPGRFSQISATTQTIAPFILVLATCALLLTKVATKGGTTLVLADLVALTLILIVIARQAMTLLENSRLTMQMRGELVISRRELQVTRREADEATRSAQEKRVLEEGVAALREVHARVARGDFAARAPTIVGPLLPIAISLNLMLDRLSALSQRGTRYDRLAHECGMLQEAVERVGQGLPPLPANQPVPQSAAELRSVFLGLAHLHRIQEGQWHRLASTLTSMNNLTRRIHETLSELKNSHAFLALTQTGFERMVLDRVIRETDLLAQQQRTMLNQVEQINTRSERLVPGKKEEERISHTAQSVTPEPEGARSGPGTASHAQYDGYNPYHQRLFQPHRAYGEPVEE